MILTGNIDVQHDALDAVGDMIISAEHEPEGPRFEKFREIAAAGTAEGGLIIGQLSHPGRQVGAHVNPVALSASDVQLGEEANPFPLPSLCPSFIRHIYSYTMPPPPLPPPRCSVCGCGK